MPEGSVIAQHSQPPVKGGNMQSGTVICKTTEELTRMPAYRYVKPNFVKIGGVLYGTTGQHLVPTCILARCRVNSLVSMSVEGK